MRRGIVAAIILVILIVAGLGAFSLLRTKDPPLPANPAIDGEQLEIAATARVFFGHQSVGANIIGGIPAVYAAHGATAPQIVDSTTPLTDDAFFENALIGQNGDPVGKLAAFTEILDGGVGDTVDVAFMKFCYVDVTADTDVPALFEEYRDTLAALERAYPGVTFLHVTTPLTTEESGAKARLKGLLGRGDTRGPADNAARERYNALLRQEYGDTGHLIDLAAVESTAPDGSRVTGTFEGQTYYALYPGYASDPGHLNSAGSEAAAAEMLKTIAAAQSSR